MRKERGFSLIELLIVVAIILIIAAIAIPNLLRARIAANESSAAASVRTISTAELTYQTSYPATGYAASLTALGPGATACPSSGPTSTNACIVDYVLASADGASGTAKSGYLFIAKPNTNTPADQYTIDAFPATVNTTGVKEFCAVEDNVVRFITPGKSGGSLTTTCATAATPIGN